MRYRVVLRRANGRYVKERMRRSRYSAKRLQHRWEERYDTTYYIEIEEVIT